MYPEKSTACTIDRGDFHACTKAPVQDIIPRRHQLCHRDQPPRAWISSPYEKLETSRAPVDTVACPVVLAPKWIGDHVIERGILAVRTARKRRCDRVILRLPIRVSRDIDKVEEIAFDQVSVQGVVDGVSALAGCVNESC